MSVNRWQQIEEIFQSALDLAPTERINFVTQNCTGDRDLQREVEKLLADYESAENFIESPVWTDSQFLNSRAKREIVFSLDENSSGEHQMAGRQIGVFELKHEIGRGGMGAVYLAGRFHFGKRTVEGFEQAIRLFEQAINTDPNFALAYTGLADCYSLLNWYQEPPPPDAWERAKKAAEKAVALDDSLAESHASLAFIKFHYERDYRGSENEFRRALNLKPNYATAHQWYAFLLSAAARHNESVTVMRRAEELEPRSAVIANAVANVLFTPRLYDESIGQAKHSLEIDPASVGAHVILRWNYEKKRMTDEASDILEKEVAVAGDTPTSRAKRAHVLAAVGRKEEARRIVDELTTTNQIQHVTPYEIAVIYSLLDDRAKSLEWLKEAKERHAVGFSFARVDPHLDNVRAEKEFANLFPNDFQQ